MVKYKYLIILWFILMTYYIFNHNILLAIISFTLMLFFSVLYALTKEKKIDEENDT